MCMDNERKIQQQSYHHRPQASGNMEYFKPRGILSPKQPTKPHVYRVRCSKFTFKFLVHAWGKKKMKSPVVGRGRVHPQMYTIMYPKCKGYHHIKDDKEYTFLGHLDI